MTSGSRLVALPRATGRLVTGLAVLVFVAGCATDVQQASPQGASAASTTPGVTIGPTAPDTPGLTIAPTATTTTTLADTATPTATVALIATPTSTATVAPGPAGFSQAGSLTITRTYHTATLLRDPDSGLVDFPGELEGRLVYLCWRLGEDRVAWYHGHNAGFASRLMIIRVLGG